LYAQEKNAQWVLTFAKQFAALHVPEILHRVAVKKFRAIQRKICRTNVQQKRFDSIFLQSSASHFCASRDVF